MTAMDLSGVTWRKSSRSNQNGYGCVEVAVAPAVVGVRDSKNADGPALIFPVRAWAACLRSTRSD